MDWMRTRFCREEKINEQTDEDADAADTEKREKHREEKAV
jgi:hypothetical protein